ncbi:MAG TPA: NAD(P)H-hydrate dehydratase, partial [Acidobacteriaceae bacterium]|nr:NAD(P)H-hydrate dehydratase [Acidobacteriaceae bacterium]
KTCDQATSERFGLPSFDLMRNAASAVVRFAQSEYPKARRIVILAGRGNNGGDGIVAARQFFDLGYEIHLILLGDHSALKGDAARAWTELIAVAAQPTIHIHILKSAGELASLSHLLSNNPPTLILDAVVGTGFQPPLRGLALDALHWLQASPELPPILAVDLPSGWNADSTADTTASAPQGPTYPADAVVTFTAPKPAHLFSRLTRRLSQPIVVAPIGSPDEAIISEQNLHWSGASKTITEADRPADSNKGMYGHVLVIGGSAGKSGAPAMASLAALRAGAGLVTAAVAPSVLPLVAAITPELMTQALAVTSTGEISSDNLNPESLTSLLKGMTVLAIGPGLGTSEEAEAFVLGLLEQSQQPAVLDADALNILSKHIDRLPTLAKDRTLVLTPHPGEMGRLANLTTKEVQADRIHIARDFAQRNNVILVLKGWRTLIAHPDGAIAINSTGNPGMAKGGSGDLLTGFVAALLAQHPKNPKEAVEAAVYLHGLAADITVQRPGPGGDQHTLLATDSLANLPLAYRFQSSNWNGYAWLQGLPSGLSTTLFPPTGQ